LSVEWMRSCIYAAITLFGLGPGSDYTLKTDLRVTEVGDEVNEGGGGGRNSRKRGRYKGLHILSRVILNQTRRARIVRSQRF